MIKEFDLITAKDKIGISLKTIVKYPLINKNIFFLLFVCI